jgi:hypothetical protein
MKPEKVPLIKVQFTPKDSPQHFLIQIPANILFDIQNLDPAEWSDICKSVTESWKRAHEEWEAAKDVPIRQFLEAQRKFNPSIPDQSDDFIAEILKAGERSSNREVKDDVLRIIKSKYYRTLNSPDIMPLIQNAVLMAVEDNDHEFFKRFGRELEKVANPYKPPKDRTPLECLLMEHWITPGEIGLHFCCFSDQALSDFLHCVAPESGPTFDAVRKTRQRLDLKQTNRKLVNTAVCRGDSIVLG